MTTVAISEKGQVTIPIDVRRKAGLKPRSRVEVEYRDGEVILRRTRTVAELAGILKNRVKPGTTFEDERRSAMQAMVKEVTGSD